VPEVGGWDGELVFAKAAGGGFRRGGTTNAIAETLNARRNCIAGRQPSGSRDVEPPLKDAGNTPRQNGSGESGMPLGRTCRRKAKPQQPSPPSLRVVTQQENILRFFVIGPDATKRCEGLPVRPPRTAVTIAARP